MARVAPRGVLEGQRCDQLGSRSSADQVVNGLADRGTPRFGQPEERTGIGTCLEDYPITVAQ